MINLTYNPHSSALARKTRWLLIGVTLVAIMLRVWGINFGLPYLHHPDEPGNVSVAQRIFKTGDLNPHSLFYPPLFYHLNAAAYAPYYLIGKLMGVFSNPADIPAPVMLAMGVGQTPMPTTFLLGRILTATFGAAAVILASLAGWQLTDKILIGLLAALMMAMSPVNVALSRYITPDTFLVFFVLLSFWASVLIFRQGKTWQYVAAGVATGLTASAKYNGALIVLPLLLAHFFRSGLRGWRDRRLYFALGAGGLTFLLTTPVLLGQDFLSNFTYNAQVYSTGHLGMEGNSLNWYLSYLLRIEGPVTLLGVMGILRGIYVRSKEIVLLSIFPLVYFTLISSMVVRNGRTLLPLTPFLFLLASSLLVSLLDQSGIQESQRWRVVAASALILISLSWPLVRTLKDTVQLTTVDSRETARIWINHNLPGGSRIAIESYSPYVDPKRFSVQGFLSMIDHTPDWYISNGFEYLVFSQGMFERFYQEPDRYSKQVSQYQDLFHEFDRVKTFTDGGYEVRIYRVARR